MKDIYSFEAEPQGAWLTVNRACNFRCKWCYAKDTVYDSSHEMSLEMAIELTMILKELGISNIMLIGGEPTLWKYLKEYNDFAKKIGITTTIITNAYMFGDDVYWGEYIQSPCDYCVISIKGVTEKQLYETVGIKDIYKAKKGMERAARFHKVSGAETVCSTLTTKQDLLEIARYSRSISAKTFLVSMCNITLADESADDEYVVLPEENKNVIFDIYQELDEMYGSDLEIHTTLPFCIWPKDFIERLLKKKQLTTACNVHGRTGIVFDYNGDVLFCNSIYDTIVAKYKKNFMDGESLMEYLNSYKLRTQYEEILRLPAECCTDCSKNAYCRGGCIANWMIMDSSICVAI